MKLKPAPKEREGHNAHGRDEEAELLGGGMSQLDDDQEEEQIRPELPWRGCTRLTWVLSIILY